MYNNNNSNNVLSATKYDDDCYFINIIIQSADQRDSWATSDPHALRHWLISVTIYIKLRLHMSINSDN